MWSTPVVLTKWKNDRYSANHITSWHYYVMTSWKHVFSVHKMTSHGHSKSQRVTGVCRQYYSKNNSLIWIFMRHWFCISYYLVREHFWVRWRTVFVRISDIIRQFQCLDQRPVLVGAALFRGHCDRARNIHEHWIPFYYWWWKGNFKLTLSLHTWPKDTKQE